MARDQIPGVVVGSNLAIKAPQTFIRYALGCVLCASGVTLIIKNGTAGVVIPAIGVASLMVGALFAAQLIANRRGSRRGGAPAATPA